MTSEDEILTFVIKILTILKDTDGLNQREIFKQTKIPPKTLVRALEYLEHEKLVDIIEHSGFFIYILNETGRKFLLEHESSKNGAK